MIQLWAKSLIVFSFSRECTNVIHKNTFTIWRCASEQQRTLHTKSWEGKIAIASTFYYYWGIIRFYGRTSANVSLQYFFHSFHMPPCLAMTWLCVCVYLPSVKEAGCGHQRSRLANECPFLLLLLLLFCLLLLNFGPMATDGADYLRFTAEHSYIRLKQKLSGWRRHSPAVATVVAHKWRATRTRARPAMNRMKA